MGIIYPQNIYLAPCGMTNYYKEKGYIIEKPKVKIEISIKDLSKGSQKKVKCKCDNCNDEFLRKFAKITDSITYCKKCYGIKAKETFIKNYGVDNPNKSSIIKEKTKKTNLKKYGVEYIFQSEDVKEKIKKSLIKNYGVESALKNKEIHGKMKNTLIKKYGVDNPLKNKEIKEKVQNTNLKRYGVKWVFQNKEIKNKIKNTNLKKYKFDNPAKNDKVKEKIRITKLEKGITYNNTQVSKNQLHIANLISGDLNVCINGFYADIVLDNIIIEYDGSGHWLSVDIWGQSINEFNKKEYIRENVFLKNNYKIIRIICKNDILLNDMDLKKSLNNLIFELNHNDYNIIFWNMTNNSMDLNRRIYV